jgi:hypothetical protein
MSSILDNHTNIKLRSLTSSNTLDHATALNMINSSDLSTTLNSSNIKLHPFDTLKNLVCDNDVKNIPSLLEDIVELIFTYADYSYAEPDECDEFCQIILPELIEFTNAYNRTDTLHILLQYAYRLDIINNDMLLSFEPDTIEFLLTNKYISLTNNEELYKECLRCHNFDVFEYIYEIKSIPLNIKLKEMLLHYNPLAAEWLYSNGYKLIEYEDYTTRLYKKITDYVIKDLSMIVMKYFIQ